MRILTNFDRFPQTWSVSTGETGTAVILKTFPQFLRELRQSDLLLINGDVSLVFRLCLYFLVFPNRRRPIVAVDMVLRKPLTWGARLRTLFKKALFARVSHFVNYFQKSEGYKRYFGITPERSSFVHFKPNLRYRYDPKTYVEGNYILCFGRSQRDYDTFFQAISLLPYPAAIPRPNFKNLKEHHSRFTWSLDRLPANLQLLDDDGSQEAMIRSLEGARLVVLPILASSMLAGVGVYLNAMLLRKCVIMSYGPGGSDVLTDEALFVPPEDPQALAKMIHIAWQDDQLRTRIAEIGHRHALSLGGEPELRQRVLEKAIAWYRAHRVSSVGVG